MAGISRTGIYDRAELKAEESTVTKKPNSPNRKGLVRSEFVSKEMFLKLLVAQIRHQNPLDPISPTQFVTQLAQLSALEQLVLIREALEKNLEQPQAPQRPSGQPGEQTVQAAQEV